MTGEWFGFILSVSPKWIINYCLVWDLPWGGMWFTGVENRPHTSSDRRMEDCKCRSRPREKIFPYAWMCRKLPVSWVRSGVSSLGWVSVVIWDDILSPFTLWGIPWKLSYIIRYSKLIIVAFLPQQKCQGPLSEPSKMCFIGDQFDVG